MRELIGIKLDVPVPEAKLKHVKEIYIHQSKDNKRETIRG